MPTLLLWPFYFKTRYDFFFTFFFFLLCYITEFNIYFILSFFSAFLFRFLTFPATLFFWGGVGLGCAAALCLLGWCPSFLIISLFVFLFYCLFFTHMSLLVPYFSISLQSCYWFLSDSTFCLCPINEDIVLSKSVGLYTSLWCFKKF